jgi:hypothetical protein
MGGHAKVEVAGELLELRSRIEAWRRKKSGKPMPEGLWLEVVPFAQSLGVAKVARALGLGFYGVRDRVNQPQAAPAEVPATFVDLGAVQDLGLGGEASEIEILGRDGSRLRMRVAPGTALDPGSIVASFMGWR